MPTCIGGTLACNISGLCLSVACPSGWTGDATTCSCDWPGRDPCPFRANTSPTSTSGAPPSGRANCNCPACLRYFDPPATRTPFGNFLQCQPYGGPFPEFYGNSLGDPDPFGL